MRASDGRSYALGQMHPRLANSVYLAAGAVVAGDVEVGEDASIWFNAVVRADVAPIRIGARSNVQDGAVLHVDPGFPCVLAEDVTVGHAAVVHGATIGRGTTVGMGAVVLSGAVVGERCIIAAGAVVRENVHIADEMLVAGVPAIAKRPLTAAEVERTVGGASGYVKNAIRFAADLTVQHHPAGIEGEQT